MIGALILVRAGSASERVRVGACAGAATACAFDLEKRPLGCLLVSYMTQLRLARAPTNERPHYCDSCVLPWSRAGATRLNRTTLLQNASPAARRAKRSHPIARREGVGSLLAVVAHFGDGCCVRFRGARAGTRAWSGSAREACAAARGWGAGLAKAVPQSHVFKSSSAASARAAAAQVSRSDKGHQASQPKVHVYSRSFRRQPR